MRAVAEAGLGNARDAAWDWHMAISLHPAYESMDLGRYGEAGAALREALDSEEVEGGLDLIEIEPPRKIHAPLPQYPPGKRQACLEHAIVVVSTIDVDGLPRWPRPLTPSQPVLGFAAMEALRDWRFEPARLDGEPVASVFNLTTNFTLRRCSGDASRQGRRLGVVKKNVE